jgi:hypothetical protein
MIPLDPTNNSDLFHNFVGYGYNGLTREPSRGIALNNKKVNLYTDDRLVTVSYKYIEDSSDLMSFMHADLNTGVSSMYGGVEFNASLGMEVENKIKTSSRSVYIIVRVMYRYGRVILSEAEMDPASPSIMWNEHRDDFYKKYGNAYIAQNIIGDSFYYIYNYKIDSKSLASKDTIKAAIHVRIAGLFDASAGGSSQNSNSLSNMNITESIDYVANGYIPPVFPTSRNEVTQVLNDFSGKMRLKYESKPLTGDWKDANTLGTILESYETLYKENSSIIDVFYMRLLDWYKIQAKLGNIKNDLSGGSIYVQEPDKTQLLNDVNPAILYCESRIKECKDQSNVSIFPPADLYSDLINSIKPTLNNPKDYNVLAPGRISFNWTRKSFMTSYIVYLDEKPINTNQSGSFSCQITEPGEHIWFVRGVDLKGNYADAVSEAFNTPGFETSACPPDQSAVEPGNYTFYFTPLKGKKVDNSDVMYKLYLNGSLVYSGNEVMVSDINISNISNSLVLETTVAGKTARSNPLTLYTLITPNIISHNNGDSTINTIVKIICDPVPGASAYKAVSQKVGSTQITENISSSSSVNIGLNQGSGSYLITLYALCGNSNEIKSAPAYVTLNLEGGVTTFAGSGAAGTSDGSALAASFTTLKNLVLDTNGNIFVIDGNALRKITPSGVVSTFAGNVNSSSNIDGNGTNARFNNPSDIAIDSSGNLFVSESSTVRKITPSGNVTTIAGRAGTNGMVNANGTNALFSGLVGIAADTSGNIYVADRGNNKIRKITSSYDVMTFSSASLNNLMSIEIDSSGNLFALNYPKIHKITPAGSVSIFSTNEFTYAANMNIDQQDNLYVNISYTGYSIYKVTHNAVVSTLKSGDYGYLDGPLSTAMFNRISGMAFDKYGNIYISDVNNHRIRKITQ